MNECSLISVIVPVYNVREYIDRCVTSILQQTYKQFEILLIDDGSTDGSEKRCDNYKESDERIRVYHKKNGGLSDARNCGIQKAKGEYLTFIDADDYVGPLFLERLLDLAKDFGSEISKTIVFRCLKKRIVWRYDIDA